jgi:hypothetical protein
MAVLAMNVNVTILVTAIPTAPGSYPAFDIFKSVVRLLRPLSLVCYQKLGVRHQLQLYPLSLNILIWQ